MAREAGFNSHHNPDLYDCMVASDKAIERFAALVAAAEREACAKVCEKIVDRPAGYNGQWEGYGNTKTHMTGYECAAAIRARGQA
jgi:hypothetical protein